MKTKITLAKAEEIANKIVHKLAPFCDRIEIAGSIRRNKAAVGDIEICCQPTPKAIKNMFGEVVRQDYFLYQVVAEIFADRTFVKNGLRYKQIDLGETNLDLFIVTKPAQWGVIFTLRTGPAEYSKWLVTTKQKGGALPSNCKSKNGAIYCNGELIEMPTEESYFDFLGLDWPEPATRKPPETQKWNVKG